MLVTLVGRKSGLVAIRNLARDRGTNKNTNGLIRECFPKGTDFAQIREEQNQEVEDRLNLRPRKRQHTGLRSRS